MYLLDANVLIEAKNRYYAFDIAPGFWTWLEKAHAQGLACNIKAVRNEILGGNDELADWTNQNPGFFRTLDQGTTRHFAPLTNWAQSRNFTPAAIAAFTGNAADYQLVAYAREHQYTLVTHERPAPNTKGRILIPDACIALDVGYTDTFKMLRATGAQLDLR